jgi:hypothetical protein
MNNVCEFINTNINSHLDSYSCIKQNYNECNTFNTYFKVLDYVSFKLHEYFGDNIKNISSIIDNNQHIIKFDVNNFSGEIWEIIEDEHYWVISLFINKI